MAEQSNLNIYQCNSADVSLYISHGTGNDDRYTNGEFSFIKNIIKDDFVVFDIGANRGQWTTDVLYFSNPKIYCFEPIVVNYEKLLKVTKDKNNVSIFNSAVNDVTGTTTIYHYTNNDVTSEMSGLFRRPEVEDSLHLNVKEEQVETVRLDYACKILGVQQIDYLKIDVEGAESLVISGLGELLDKEKTFFIQFEYGGCWKDASFKLEDVYALLREKGYELYRIIPEGLMWIEKWIPELENYAHSNLVAIGSNIIDIRNQTKKENTNEESNK